MIDFFQSVWGFIVANKSTLAQAGIAMGTIWLALVASREPISNLLFKPKLKMKNGEKFPFIVEDISKEVDDLGFVDIYEHRIYYNLELENIGRKLAKNVYAEIEELWWLASSGYIPMTDSVSKGMSWVGSDDLLQNIYPTQKKHVNVIFITNQEHNPVWKPKQYHAVFGFFGVDEQALSHYRYMRDMLSGTFRVKVSIYGDNIKPIQQWYQIDWQGFDYSDRYDDDERTVNIDFNPFADETSLVIKESTRPGQLAKRKIWPTSEEALKAAEEVLRVTSQILIK